MNTIDSGKFSFAVMDLAAIAALSLLLVSLLTIQPLYPADRVKTDDRKPVFRWNGMQGDFVISVDDNPGFTSPETADVGGNSHAFGQEFDFGTYYWKVESGPFSSGVEKFTVVSSVILSRDEEGITNEGNAELFVRSSGITGAFVLGMNESAQIGEEENVIAEQA